MRKIALLLICSCFLICSCSTSQLGAAATGTSLGGMFGSSIGGLAGGYKGHQIGTLVGMTTGAAVGIAAATPKNEKSKNTDSKSVTGNNSIVEYGEYEPNEQTYNAYANEHPLEVVRVLFTDANNNRRLEAYESAALIITFVNRSNQTVYNLSPKITCDNRHVDIASLSPIAEIQPQQRVRYRVEIIGKKKLKDSTTRFEVMVKNGKIKEVIKSFDIQTSK